MPFSQATRHFCSIGLHFLRVNDCANFWILFTEMSTVHQAILPNDTNFTKIRRMAENYQMSGKEVLAATEITNAETDAMLRAFFNLAKRWALSDQEGRILLGSPAARTYARWKAGQIEPSRISRDTRERLSILMGIHKSLRYLFHDPARGYAWLRKPNQAFGGESALTRLLAGSITDLSAVRAYLDAERAGW